jgi:hypothetical protein
LNHIKYSSYGSGKVLPNSILKRILFLGALVVAVFLLLIFFITPWQETFNAAPPPTSMPPVTDRQDEPGSEPRWAAASVANAAKAVAVQDVAARELLLARTERSSSNTSLAGRTFALRQRIEATAAIESSERLRSSANSPELESDFARIDDSPTWNYWLEAQATAGPVPHPTSRSIKLNSPNRLQFRLSTFDISTLFVQVGGIQSSRELTSVIEAGINDETRSVLPLDILIHPVDEQRLRISPESRHIVLMIDLNSYRAAQRDAKLRPQPGEAPIEDVLRKATIAEFGFDFIALTPGVHQVGIAIIDAASGFPLQSMIVSLGVEKEWPQSVLVDASRPTMFSSNSPPFDLSLYLYQLQSMVDGQMLSSLQAQLRYMDQATRKPIFIDWRTDIDSLEALHHASATFRDTVGSVDTAADLLHASYEFSRLIFDPVPDNGNTAPAGAERNIVNATRAREAIIAAATYSIGQRPPSMLVKIIGGTLVGESRYSSAVLPVGALAVSLGSDKDAVYLGERFSLALMLAGQQVSAGTTCPGNWYVALPKIEDNSIGPLHDALADLTFMLSKWPDKTQLQPQSVSLSELRTWLNNSPADKTQASYVFSYLGHHGAGRLFLDQATEGVSVGSMRRDFQGSSIAILNACEIAMETVSDGTPIGRLARRKVAATIATTSKISGHLAAAYMDCLTAVLDKHADLNVGEAQAYATQCLWSKEAGQAYGKRYEFGGAALKYILIGNPFQRICAPTTKETMQ